MPSGHTTSIQRHFDIVYPVGDNNNEPLREKTSLRRCATREDSNRPALLRKTARAAVEISVIEFVGIVLSGKRKVKTFIRLRMRRLICVFVIRSPTKTGFLTTRLICQCKSFQIHEIMT